MFKWKVLLLLCVALCSAKTITKSSGKQTEKTPFELSDVIPNKFGQRGFGGTWISGNEFTLTSNENFIKYNVETKAEEIILTKAFIDSKGWSRPTFRFSTDGSKILVRYAQRQIFRHSTVSKFSVISYPSINDAEIKIANGNEVQTAFFTPSSNGMAYIENNNIFYLNFANLASVTQLTLDGIPGIVYNGIPDWVYEEEVLGTDAASWFSPNGDFLAYARFDDRDVREAVCDIYGNGDRQYPEEVHLRYPKVCGWSSLRSLR